MYKFYNSNAYKGSLTPGAFPGTISGAALWRHASTPHSLLSDKWGVFTKRYRENASLNPHFEMKCGIYWGGYIFLLALHNVFFTHILS